MTAVLELVFLAAAEHGKNPLARMPLRIVPASGPMFAADGDSYLMKLSATALDGDYRQQALYQAAHEAVHVVCSPLRGYTWVDEMFAVWFAWRVVQAITPTYPDSELRTYQASSEQMPASELVQLDLGAFAGEAYPDGTYGRALLVGLELDALLGWDAVRALARPGSAAQCMELDAWLDTLAPEDAERARAVVGLGP